MAVRPAPKSPIKTVVSNREAALDLVKAAVQGSLSNRIGATPAAESSDAAVNQARTDGYYLADLLYYTTSRLDRRDSQD